MKYGVPILLSVITGFVMGQCASFVSTATAAEPTTELLIDMHDTTAPDDVRNLELLIGTPMKLNSIHAMDERFFIASVPTKMLGALFPLLQKHPAVEHADINWHVRALETGWTAPNDPMYEQQWNMHMVNAERAWASTLGEGVIVAVIDTGVAFENHEGFVQVEDLDGTSFVAGYDFVNDDECANDDHGHGTHVAGTIAQVTNNGVGVAGLAPKATIMPLKVLGATGGGTTADIADAIRFAADKGANVINMSLGGGGYSATLEAAVAYARSKGVVVVCAAGNSGRGVVEYPAAYAASFAVSAVGPDRSLAFYSSWGPEIDIAAPGGDTRDGAEGGILQNTIRASQLTAPDAYLAFQGTSMATPHVAAAAALLFASIDEATPDQVELVLKETAQEAGPRGWDDHFGHGILDAGAAVELASGSVTITAKRPPALPPKPPKSDTWSLLLWLTGLLLALAATARWLFTSKNAIELVERLLKLTVMNLAIIIAFVKITWERIKRWRM